MNIVGDDQAFIIGLMYAIHQVDNNPTQKIMLFLSKFGQKEEKGLDLVTLVRRDGVKAITCHAACTLASEDPRVDLLWSRYGLQEVVGHRGSIYTSYAIPKAANFQSNLDQHPLTVDWELLQVFQGDQSYSELTFVQLYANTPHVHMPLTKHPVNRVITTCGLHNKAYERILLQRATAYINHMDDLARKTTCRTHARMEVVFLLEGRFPFTIRSNDFFSTPPLHRLLQETPLLL